MRNMCIRCRKETVYIKKCKLCKNCYQKMRAKERLEIPSKRRLFYGREIEFIKNYFTHQKWIYQPAIFRLKGSNYEPDFYDGERNVFIEVAGTRQAFHQNLEKYREFLNTFPMLKFEVRNAKGGLIAISDLRGKFRGETP